MASERPKVLVVGAFPPPGSGIAGGIVTACRALLSPAFSKDIELLPLDSTMQKNPPPGLMVRGVSAARRLLTFCWLVMSRRPDAVILFASPGASLVEKGVMALFCRLTKTPVAMFPRGGSIIDAVKASGAEGVLSKAALSQADQIFCQGPAWRTFSSDYLGYDERHAPIIPNWTATEALLEVGRRRVARPGGRTRFIFVGWVVREKGVAELLWACAELSRRYDLELVLIGDGAFRAGAENLVREYGLTERVNFHGWAKPEAVVDHLASADVFVLPSYAEGLPNAMIEAMAAGLPVAVSSVGTIPQLIRNGEHGILFPPRDREALKDALVRLMDDREFRDALGHNGHLLAGRTFAAEAAMAKLVASTLSMISDHKALRSAEGLVAP